MVSSTLSGSMPLHDDPSWPLYPQTILHFGGPSPLSIDLRYPLASTDLSDLRQLDLPLQFSVITPENPRGRIATRAQNNAYWATFCEECQDAGHRSLPCNGSSLDGRHTERGRALDIDKSRSISIASRWSQSAFFWFDGYSFWVIPALSQCEPLRLPEL